MANGYVNRLNADSADGMPQYPALAERLFALPSLAPGLNSLDAKEGRRLGGGLDWAISADGLNVVVQPGTCVIASPDAVNGPYVVAIPTAVTLPLPARPAAGQYRRSRVIVRVYDEEYAGAATTLREVRVELVNGTAQSANPPSVPALPALSLALGQVLQDSTSATVYSSGATSSRTWAAGGIGVVYSQADRDALAQYDGLVVYRDDLDTYEGRIAGSWRTIASGATPYIRCQHDTTTRNPGANIAINWANVIAAEGGASLSGSRINVPAGVYLVTYQVTGDWDQWPITIELRRNAGGTPTGGSALGSSLGSDNHSGSQSVSLQRVVRLNEGDYLETFLAAHVNAGLGFTMAAVGAQNFIDVVRVAT